MEFRRVLFRSKLSDIINSPILGFSDGCGYRLKLNEWLEHEKITPTKVMELGTLETTLGSVISGLGIAYVPYSAVEHYEASGLITCFYLPKEDRKSTRLNSSHVAI